MKTDIDEALVAIRELDLLSEDGKKTTKVIIKLGKPEKIPGVSAYRCPFKIIGIDAEKIRYGEGADPMQALILALTKIGSYLYTSDESLSKRLSWMETLNLGFPAFVDEYPSDFVPAPADKLLL